MDHPEKNRPLLQAKHLRKTFLLQSTSFGDFLNRFTLKGKDSKTIVKAINDVSMTVNHREIVGLVGESGSGKTTLARLLLRLLSPDLNDKEPPSQIWFDGEEIIHLSRRQMRRRRAKMRMMFQHPESALNPFLRIREILTESIEMYDSSSSLAREDLLESLLTSVRLPNVLEQYPRDLSGGQQRRISILRTLVGKPKLIVADEPVASLDASIQAQIIDLIREISETQQIAFLLISHNLSLVLSLSHRVMVMYGGHIVETGQKKEILEAVVHPYTIDLWQSANYDLDRMRQRNRSPLRQELSEDGCRYRPHCRLYELLTTPDQGQLARNRQAL